VSKYKKGDRVILVTDKYGDYPINPIWKGAFGKVVGTIREVVPSEEYPYKVGWIHNQQNAYKEEDLNLYLGGEKKMGTKRMMICPSHHDGSCTRREHSHCEGIHEEIQGCNNKCEYSGLECIPYKSSTNLITKVGEKLMNIPATAKETADKLYAYIKPYEKWIGLVALAACIDHFFLDNKFMGRFKAIAEALVTRITDGLDSLVKKLEVGDGDDV
jgi:hypothetical protein